MQQSNAFAEFLKTRANTTTTQNGALAHKTTGNPVLDLFSLGGAARSMAHDDIYKLVKNALNHDFQLTIRCLFYLRDVRGGQGERQFFRNAWLVIDELYQSNDPAFKEIEGFKILHLVDKIPEYGRWDDLVFLIEHVSPDLRDYILSVIRRQIATDSINMVTKKPISLLAKWMPSETSGKATKKIAKVVRKSMEMTPKMYRKTLSKLRAYLKVLERELCAKEWSTINYSAVPSQASKLYRKAFYRHDAERYGKFIEKAKTGEVKINTGTLAPHQIVSSYLAGSWSNNWVSPVKKEDSTLEALWKQLPDYCKNIKDSSLVVADTSGSMQTDGAIYMSLAMGIYMAERSQGAFKDHFMVFSANPLMVKLQGDSLLEKLRNIPVQNANTDYAGVLAQLLHFAVQMKATPEDMPKTLYIVSDMQFDQIGNGRYGDLTTIHTHFKKQYESQGYQLPRIVYWQVNSGTGGIQAPVTKSEINTILVSGNSAKTFEHLAAMEFPTPEQAMLKVLNSPRYSSLSME